MGAIRPAQFDNLVKVTKVVSHANGQSGFEEDYIEMEKQEWIGGLSKRYPVKSIQFKQFEAAKHLQPPHATTSAPHFEVHIEGTIYIKTDSGDRLIKPGELVLYTDCHGNGHSVEAVDPKADRLSVLLWLE